MSLGGILRRVQRTLNFLIENGWLRKNTNISNWIERTSENRDGLLGVPESSPKALEHFKRSQTQVERPTMDLSWEDQ